jgi:hypothetical protein
MAVIRPWARLTHPSHPPTQRLLPAPNALRGVLGLTPQEEGKSGRLLPFLALLAFLPFFPASLRSVAPKPRPPTEAAGGWR